MGTELRPMSAMTGRNCIRDCARCFLQYSYLPRSRSILLFLARSLLRSASSCPFLSICLALHITVLIHLLPLSLCSLCVSRCLSLSIYLSLSLFLFFPLSFSPSLSLSLSRNDNTCARAHSEARFRVPRFACADPATRKGLNPCMLKRSVRPGPMQARRGDRTGCCG